MTIIVSNIKELKMKGSLELGKRYKREDVHGIFCPSSTSMGGTWSQHGMFRIEKEKNDWIFYISLGHKQGDHQFTESISPTGILSWQTQPSLNFKRKSVKDLLSFDIETDKIYLFFRLDKDKNKDRSYMYLGELDYFNHDSVLQEPVHISWKLLDWDRIKNNEFIQQIFEEQIRLLKQFETESKQSQSQKKSKETKEPRRGALKEVPAPTAQNKKVNEIKGSKKKERVGTLNLKPSLLKEIGDEGERLVLKYEIEQLRKNGYSDLAEKVIHSSVIQGDGLGYDILSHFPDEHGTFKNEEESYKYIEVKTTNQSLDAPFFISSNELEFAREMRQQFLLYRVYLPDEDKDKKDASETFSFFVVNGVDLLENWTFTTSSYKVARK